MRKAIQKKVLNNYRSAAGILINGLLVIGVMLLIPNELISQNTKQITDDYTTIDGIMNAYYDIVSGPAGKSVNLERDKALHHPDAWVAISYNDSEAGPKVVVMSLEEFHGDNRPRKEGFYEKEINREVRRYGNMAHIWSYKSVSKVPEGQPFEQGTNSITLFNDGERWWVMGWMIDNTVKPDID